MDPRRIASALIPLVVALVTPTQAQWQQQESEHFVAIYREPFAHLVPRILRCAEASLARLGPLFRYTPAEKIHVLVHSGGDYGSAAAQAVPYDLIRLDPEPMELAYESMPFDDRIQWLLSHELVHVVVNDGAGARPQLLPRKVAPEKDQPLTVVHSVVGSAERYTPRWHQEGIASFLETWLSGGFGRALGSFDEMYFRSLVVEGRPLATRAALEGEVTETSFLVGMAHYLYGTRFVTYLATTYGTDRLLDFYRPAPRGAGGSLEARFRFTFGTELGDAWAAFASDERAVQEANLRALDAAPLTEARALATHPLGWVTQAYADRSRGRVLFGHHEPDRLSAVVELEIASGTQREIGRLSSPGLLQVAASAFDPELGLFFYTTNNDRLYRDVWALDVRTGSARRLFQDARVGDLTVASITHELWGVRHSAGRAVLVHSAYPYRRLAAVVELADGEALQHLAVSPSGRYLAATLHRGGAQAVVVLDVEPMRRGEPVRPRVITAEGSPEFPSWGRDERHLYWNAYTSGVSNIYRRALDSSAPAEAVSHTLRGLFRPLELSPDSLFAFEFTSEGFVPVLVPNRPAGRVPAIRYSGQRALQRNPQLASWAVSGEDAGLPRQTAVDSARPYGAMSHLRVHALTPAVSGFRDRLVVGLFGHVADPLSTHDLSFEVGTSVVDRAPHLHVRGQYQYRRTYAVGVEHDAPDFFSLWSGRLVGAPATRLSLSRTAYLKYDIPHEITHHTELSFVSGARDRHRDGLGSTRPLLMLETSIESKNTRRAIGSVDAEFGDAWKATLTGFAATAGFDRGGSLQASWSHFATWARPHNVLHLQLAGGLAGAGCGATAGRFVLGGFGNRRLEKEGPKLYREPLSFPGLPAGGVPAVGFGRITLEHNLPPLRLVGARLGSHRLRHIDASWYAQGLVAGMDNARLFANVGGQINLVLEHWANLESTLSLGAARAWGSGGGWGGFVSLKLLR